MKKNILACAALTSALLVSACAGPGAARAGRGVNSAAAVEVSALAGPERGWMSNAWNWANFTFKSGCAQDLKVTRFEGRWKNCGEAWTESPNVNLPSGGEAKWDCAMYYPNEARLAAQGAPSIDCLFTLEGSDGSAYSLSASMPVRTAGLETPLVALTGNYMVVCLQKKNWTGAPWEKEMVGWMDEAYKCMWDLTGHRPFDGALSRIEETPNSFAWAYAGNPIVLTMDFVPSTMEDFHQGLMSFGWTHEMGHNFDDDIGDYYIWSGPCCEFQANLKLTYAMECMKSHDRLGLRWKGTDYYPFPKEERMATDHLGDAFFYAFADAYLADSSRTFESLSSDEIHAFYMRIVKVYGWEAIKRWYRLFVELKEKGVPPVQEEKERLPLALAAMNKACGHNLIKTYQLWRFPITQEKLDETARKYGWGL